MAWKIREILEQRKRLIEEAGKLVDKADEEKRHMSSEEEKRFDDMHGEADRLGKLAEKMEAQERVQKEEIEREERTKKATPRDLSELPEQRKAFENRTMNRWIRYGMNGLNSEERALMASRRVQIEDRALAVGTGSAGGFTVKADFSGKLESALKAFGGMRKVSTALPTGTGASLPYPTENDTGNVGAIFAENSQVTELDVAFGQIVFDAFMYSSRIVRVSFQMLQDSEFDIEGLLAEKFAARIGRILNTHCTTGTGTGQPNGITTAAFDSTVQLSITNDLAGTAAAAALLYNKLVDIEGAVDPDYRPGASWMFNDAFLKILKKAKDSTNRPLFRAAEVPGQIDSVLGYPFTVNQDMPSITATNRSVVFGNLKKYLIRDVKDFTILRLEERYAEFLQVGFLAYSRHDGDLIDAGTHPVVYAAIAA